MSFTERLWVWLHVAFVIFTIGPVTIATMSTPRYIRAGNIGVLRYLSRMTRIFGAASLGVLLFGIIAGQSLHDMAKTWITASLTLFVVALVLLVLIMRDQRRAIAALETAQAAPAQAAAQPPAEAAAQPPAADLAEPTAADVEPAPAQPRPTATTPATAGQAAAAHLASVERGRIASMAGVVSLIWLVILVLMIWNT
jgi:predicted lipid-binding transport protein (Tim44 family)